MKLLKNQAEESSESQAKEINKLADQLKSVSREKQQLEGTISDLNSKIEDEISSRLQETLEGIKASH